MNNSVVFIGSVYTIRNKRSHSVINLSFYSCHFFILKFYQTSDNTGQFNPLCPKSD